MENSRDEFQLKWCEYIGGIVKYAEASSSQPRGLRHALRGSDYAEGELHCSVYISNSYNTLSWLTCFNVFTKDDAIMIKVM